MISVNRRTAIAPEKSDWAIARSDPPIDLRRVAEVLEPWSNGRPISKAAFLPGGLMNRNYRVRVGEDDVVLRFYDRSAAACAKESAILRAAHGILRVPELLFASADARPTPFTVLEFVSGISLREMKTAGTPDAVAEAAYDVGQQLAALRTVVVRPEDIGVPNIDPDILSGSNVNARLIEHFASLPLLRQRLSDEVAERVRDFAWQRESLLSPHLSQTSLAHGDFNSPNLLVAQRGGRWRVAAVLDWEFAFLGHLFYDIGNFLRYERPRVARFEPWFSRGLADGGVSLPSDWLATARVADLGALCELLTRTGIPGNVVAEVRGLILSTLADCSA